MIPGSIPEIQSPNPWTQYLQPETLAFYPRVLHAQALSAWITNHPGSTYIPAVMVAVAMQGRLGGHGWLTFDRGFCMGAHSFIPFEEPERQARPENPQPMPYTSGALRRAHLWVHSLCAQTWAIGDGTSWDRRTGREDCRGKTAEANGRGGGRQADP